MAEASVPEDVRLLFVYNARPGLLNGMADSFHKALSPASYPCGLCALTHGFFTMRRPWKDWLHQLRLPHQFLYRDAFRQAWPDQRDLALPIIALIREGRLEPVVSASEFREMASLEVLISTLDARLAALGVTGR